MQPFLPPTFPQPRAIAAGLLKRRWYNLYMPSDPHLLLLTLFLVIVGAALFGRFVMIPIFNAHARSIGITSEV